MQTKNLLWSKSERNYGRDMFTADVINYFGYKFIEIYSL